MVIRLFASIVAAVAIATAATAGAAQPSRFIPTLDEGDAIPPIPLIAQDGRRFTLADFRGDAVIVSFIYTRCRDARMCPLVSAKFARAARAVGSAPIRLVLITLDPAYDTPAVLRRYGRAFGQPPRVWTLATGSATTAELATRSGIATPQTRPGDIIHGDIIHTEAAVIVGPDGRIARMMAGNGWSSDDLLAAARAALPGGSDLLIGPRTWLTAALERCGGGAAGLGGTAMLAIFGTILAGVGGLFWLAFRNEPASR